MSTRQSKAHPEICPRECSCPPCLWHSSLQTQSESQWFPGEQGQNDPALDIKLQLRLRRNSDWPGCEEL